MCVFKNPQPAADVSLTLFSSMNEWYETWITLTSSRYKTIYNYDKQNDAWFLGGMEFLFWC